MKLKNLRLDGFRNLSQLQVEFHPGLNFILGLNGQGKTSILEAISVLSNLESFRTHQLKDTIQYGSVQSIIEGEFLFETDLQKWNQNLKVHLQLSPQGRLHKSAFLNEKLTKSSTQYLMSLQSKSSVGFHAISFNPSDHELIEGDPKIRRTYLNHVVASQDAEYLVQLKRYLQVVEQRNRLLKLYGTPDFNYQLLESFTEPMLQLSVDLSLKRILWLNNIIPRVNRRLGEISAHHQLPVFVEYDLWGSDNNKLSLFGAPVSINAESLKAKLLQRMNQTREAEFRIQSSLWGAHRDHWLLSTDFAPLKGRASQGEVRSVLLALKLSEIENYEMTTSIKPVLLLDDFSSELDLERRELLLSYLLSLRLQAFVTTTEKLKVDAFRFEVTEGKVKPMSVGFF